MPAPPRQCAILVGGLGSRLGALTERTPKPLLDVAGRPFLAWLMREAQRWGIEDFILLAGHLADRIEAAAPDLAALLPRPARIRISREPAPLGTGGALRHAAPLLDDTFLLLNGDSLLLADLGPALAAWTRDGPDILCRMVLRAVPDAARYGVATVDGETVTGLLERPAAPGPGLINAGIFLMDHRVTATLGAVGALERDGLPPLIAAGAVRATIAEGWFVDIGVPEDLAAARRDVAAMLAGGSGAD